MLGLGVCTTMGAVVERGDTLDTADIHTNNLPTYLRHNYMYMLLNLALWNTGYQSVQVNKNGENLCLQGLFIRHLCFINWLLSFRATKIVG